MPVPSTIPPIGLMPEPPNRATDSPTIFYQKADTWVDHEYNHLQPEMNVSITGMNEWGVWANDTAIDVSADADRAEAAADAVADYKGDWVAGYNTTGYDAGDAVTYGTVGGIYASKIIDNLTEPTDGTVTSEWNYTAPSVKSITAGTNISVTGTDTEPIVSFDGASVSLTGAITEEVASMPADEINPANGTAQLKVMTVDSTFTEIMETGQYVVVRLTTGGFTPTWPAMTWIGGAEPTYTTTDDILFYQIGSEFCGAYIGSVVA